MPGKSSALVVAVTGLNAIDSPGPGVAVIRAIREGIGRPVRIIGLAYENLEPGIYMDGICDKTYQISYPAAGAEVLFNVIKGIHGKEKIDVIIPNFDAELYNFITIAPRLKSLGIHSFLPSFEMFDARDKLNLYSFGQKNNFFVPKDRAIYSINDLSLIEEEFGYPLVVKGKFYEAVVAYTLEQAQKAFLKISAKWGLPIIVQQFIQGTEINIAALGDGEGNAISIIPMKKLYITDKGKAWAGITLQDDSLIELAKKFIAVTKWRGGFELEVMRTADDELYIMEINPRFPAWIYLSAGAGQNQPASLVKMALGEKVEPFTDYDAGKLFIRYAWDLVVDVSRFQQFSAFGQL
ncbi:MAG: ATP-grasp domain-containing protein [Sphingobacteriales bacterium]|nr:ATP-grasp domain-containing protein [Sphingobacteriales bacterium]